ncbi:PDZK1-interacting protein 1 precursor [Danio rerio]|uniref:Novel protein n=1 Tax=Danio rerio TaxID=7955 RepID=Q90X36_DANRE|nr:PDZK1-interacting protein 1 precursor [Danio rerio]AAI33074.1 PDZK1 interacting protein 1, like [Danio rerio]CAC95233.1 novel protein [Danio rerio]|eukprot:NP_001007761.1 PDZK1-interacting protein 1 precursor [Danio rerio]
MGKPVSVFYWFLLTLGLVAAQAETAGRALPNWLTGIIAVAVFLFLVFISFLVNKAWCNNPSQPEAVIPNAYAMTNGSSIHETSLDAVRSGDGPNMYENVIVHQTEEKVTAM